KDADLEWKLRPYLDSVVLTFDASLPPSVRTRLVGLAVHARVGGIPARVFQGQELQAVIWTEDGRRRRGLGRRRRRGLTVVCKDCGQAKRHCARGCCHACYSRRRGLGCLLEATCPRPAAAVG